MAMSGRCGLHDIARSAATDRRPRRQAVPTDRATTDSPSDRSTTECPMAHLPEAVHRLFAQQHGMASHDAAAESVTTRRSDPSGSRRAVSIVSFLRGVYRSPSWPIDELSRCAAVCVGRPYAAIAGPTAGRISASGDCHRTGRMHVLDATGSEAGRRNMGRRPIERLRSEIRTSSHRPDGLRITTSCPDRTRPRPLRAT